MARRRKDPFTCPKCGAKAREPSRTWTLVSPLPDKYGRITVTIMGSLRCPECGASWTTAIKKIKTGGEEKPQESEEERRGEVIVIDLDELDEEEL